jgi:PAS domain S-box-containing protein
MLSSRSLFVAGCLLGAVVSLPVASPALRNRDKPGATGLLILAPGAGLFSIAIALLWSPVPDWAVYAARNAVVASGVLLGFGWIATVGEHTNTIRPGRRLFAVAGSYLIIVQTLALTNPAHHLFYTPVYAWRSEQLFALPLPLNLVHVFFIYFLALVACGLLLSDILTATDTRRTQSAILLVCIVPPLCLNVSHLLKITSFNWTPLGFVVTTLGIGWAVFRADFLDIVPVGRSRAVRSMSDPVVAIDTEGRIIDANPAARELADVGSGWEATTVESFFESFPSLVERLRAGGEHTVTVTHRGRQRDFSLTDSEVGGRQNRMLARVVVLREITQLKKRERELNLLNQVQSRVLRHNIRNELDIIKAQNEQLAAELDSERAKLAEAAMSSADRLISLSSKARVVEQLVNRDENPTTVDLATTVERVAETHREAYPAVIFDVSAPSSCPIETLPSIEVALANLVENAAEHNTAPEPTVEVTLTSNDDEAVVTITDNGPGIPEQELAVRERNEETPLKHGKGLGLWVVDWVIGSSGASLTFDTDTDGTTATVRLPRYG